MASPDQCHHPLPYLGKFIYTYDDGATKYEVNFIDETTVHWMGILGSEVGVGDSNPYMRVVVAPDVHFINWKENNGSIVTQAVNLVEETVNTIAVSGGEHFHLHGTIKRVEEEPSSH